ncbi:STAS domain-containing protein [Streptomyces sp. NBC_00344]
MVHSGVARVTLIGELDLDTAPLVRETVASCLAKQPTSLCLDLADVSFCDCAGLGALLRARTAILLSDVSLVVEGIGPPLARLLALIGAGDILTERSSGTDTEPVRRAPGAVAARHEAGETATVDQALRDHLA